MMAWEGGEGGTYCVDTWRRASADFFAATADPDGRS